MKYGYFETEGEEEPKIVSHTEKDGTNQKFWFHFWAILASVSFGSKMTFIGISKLHQAWLFFFEHLMLLFTGLSIYLIIRLKAQNINADIGKIFKDKAMLIWCMISGITNSLGNVFIIFGIHFWFAAGVSPAAMNCLINLNTVLLLIYGIYFFREKHTFMEYVGAGLVLVALGIIALQRGIFTKKKKLEDDEVDTDFYFTLALILTLCCSLSWACVGGAAKYASYHYDSVVEEYSMITMIISGAWGTFAIFVIWGFGIEMQPEKENMIPLYIFSACAAGFFTVFGIYAFMKALSYGSVGVAALFANMQIIIELIEEFFIFQIVPTLASFWGMLIALLGSSFMILFQHQNSRGVH